MIALKLKEKESGQEILPAFWTDNYLNLLPGESKKVYVDLNDERPKENLKLECKPFNLKNPIVVML